MKLLVFGASGKTGHQVVAQALEQGHAVTAFVRDPSRLQIKQENLHVTRGDVSLFEGVALAVRNQDAVISALGASSPFRYDRSVVVGMGNIVRAMLEEKVTRLIYMSAINVSASRSLAGPLIRILAPLLLRTESAGHEEREKIIRSSQLNWTIVRSAGLTNGERKKDYRSGEIVRARGLAASISRADVADFLLKQLTDSTYSLKTPVVMY